jgi:hypothetical protein
VSVTIVADNPEDEQVLRDALDKAFPAFDPAKCSVDLLASITWDGPAIYQWDNIEYDGRPCNISYGKDNDGSLVVIYIWYHGQD